MRKSDRGEYERTRGEKRKVWRRGREELGRRGGEEERGGEKARRR